MRISSVDWCPSAQRILKYTSGIPFQRVICGSSRTSSRIPEEYLVPGGTWVPGFTRRSEPMENPMVILYQRVVEVFIDPRDPPPPQDHL